MNSIRVINGFLFSNYAVARSLDNTILYYSVIIICGAM